MTKTLKSSLAAALAFGALTLAALTLGAPAASAMPMGVAPAAPGLSQQIDAVRWVCGPYRCYWQPNHRHPRHYRPYGRHHW